MIRSASACSRGMPARVMTRGSAPFGHLFRLFLSSSKTAAAADDDAGWTYDHDVLVVGGGIVGCTLACRLAQQGVTASTKTAHKVGVSREETNGDDTQQKLRRPRPSVRLVEARPPSPSVGDGKLDPRVYALAPASVKVFQSLGIWEGEQGEAGRGRLLPGVRSQAFRDMQVWDDRGPGFLRFDGETPGEPLGFISEHGILHSALFEKVKEFEAEGSLDLTCPAQVKRVAFPAIGKGGSRGPVTVTLETASGETSDVTCRLLVAADGGNSKVAKMLGLSSWGWGYGQRAVVATVRLAESRGTETAFQRYLARGPLAVLPLQDGMASLVWSTTPEHAELLKAMTEQEFLNEVNDALRQPPAVHGMETSTASSASRPDNCSKFPPLSALLSAMGGGGVGVGGVSSSAGFSKVIGGVSALAAPPIATVNAIAEGIVKEAEGVAWALAGLSLGLEAHGAFSTPPEAVEVMTPRLGFDLSLRQANAYVGERAALVGDAAHTVHPMAGQGLNLGIADADALARAVQEGKLSGTDVGSKTLLSLYEQERKTEALVMMSALDSLHRLFGAEGRAVAAVRSAGLSALNAAGPVKRRLAKHAMGGGGSSGSL